jgi:hypothetical protein
VEDAVVLNVGIVADADLVDIAAEDRVHPDAGVFAKNDVADELGGVVDVASVGELGRDAFVGADHGYLMMEVLCRTTVCRMPWFGGNTRRIAAVRIFLLLTR